MKALILRGLPGSGKSTYAKRRKGKVVSADAFFTDKAYKFDHSQLRAAHIECFKQYLAYLQAGEPLVIVDNTNITAAELSPYALAAESFGYDVEIHEFMASVQEAAKRNIHHVPRKTIQNMALRMQQAPKWWKVIRHNTFNH